MGILTMVKGVFGIVKELLVFFWRKKMWWLIPFIVVLLAFGVLFIIASTTGLGPFIYALF